MASHVALALQADRYEVLKREQSAEPIEHVGDGGRISPTRSSVTVT